MPALSESLNEAAAVVHGYALDHLLRQFVAHVPGFVPYRRSNPLFTAGTAYP
jgi:hypothetical protein